MNLYSKRVQSIPSPPTPADRHKSLQPSSSSTTLLPGRVGRSRSDILNSTDPHTGSCEGSESGLTSWTGLLGPGSTGSTELDVEGGDSDFLALSSDILSGQHGGVWLWNASARHTP